MVAASMTAEQKALVVENMHVADKYIFYNYTSNPAIAGFSREDLRQTGYLALCKAALHYNGRVKFETYAQRCCEAALRIIASVCCLRVCIHLWMHQSQRSLMTIATVSLSLRIPRVPLTQWKPATFCRGVSGNTPELSEKALKHWSCAYKGFPDQKLLRCTAVSQMKSPPGYPGHGSNCVLIWDSCPLSAEESEVSNDYILYCDWQVCTP